MDVKLRMHHMGIALYALQLEVVPTNLSRRSFQPSGDINSTIKSQDNITSTGVIDKAIIESLTSSAPSCIQTWS